MSNASTWRNQHLARSALGAICADGPRPDSIKARRRRADNRWGTRPVFTGGWLWSRAIKPTW